MMVMGTGKIPAHSQSPAFDYDTFIKVYTLTERLLDKKFHNSVIDAFVERSQDLVTNSPKGVWKCYQRQQISPIERQSDKSYYVYVIQRMRFPHAEVSRAPTYYRTRGN